MHLLRSIILTVVVAFGLTSALPSSNTSILPLTISLAPVPAVTPTGTAVTTTVTSSTTVAPTPTAITSSDSTTEVWTPRICNDTVMTDSPYFILTLPARSGYYTWKQALSACQAFNGDFADINTQRLKYAESIYAECKQKLLWAGSWQSDSTFCFTNRAPNDAVAHNILAYGGQVPLVYDGYSVIVSPEMQLVNNDPIVHHVLCERRGATSTSS